MGSLQNLTDHRPFSKPVVDFTSPERLEGRMHSLPELVNFNAESNAGHAFCMQMRTDGSLDTINHADFKVALDNCIRWLKTNVPNIANPTSSGASGIITNAAPVALLMESDFNLIVHEFSLMSIGVPPLVLSPRLPPAAIMHLLQATGASTFIVSQRLSIPAKPALEILKAKGVSTHVSQPYYSFLQPEQGAPSAQLAVPNNLDEVILLLHSSGTTGLPKPIQLTHRQLLFAVNCHKFDSEEEAQGLNVSSLPLFHGFGLVAPGLSMSAGKTAVYPAGDAIPTAASIINLINKTKAKSLMTIPFLLDDMVGLPGGEGFKALAGLDFVGTGGAALGAGVGDLLSQHGVKLLNFYGTTESGPLSLTFVPKDNYDWRYFRLRTDMEFSVAELDPCDGERRFRLTVFPYGGKEGLQIPDQLVRNEKHPDTDFAAVGRDDDVIVLATGEKADPSILESLLGEAPMVKSAVAFGENQFQLGVIVEPVQPVEPGQEDAFLGTIWPIIGQAGEKMDKFSRIPSRDAVVLVKPGVAIPRTDKGSVARKEVYALFQYEIQDVYKKLSQAGGSEVIEPLRLESLEDDLKSLVQKHTGLQLESETNLFDMGIDSLQSQHLRRVIVASTSKVPALQGVDVSRMIPPEFVYLHPSIGAMLSAFRSQPGSSASSDESVLKEVKDMVNEYTLQGSCSEERSPSVAENAIVLVTGSHGSLGSHCLASLAQSKQVKKIICLVRKGSRPGQSSSPTGAYGHRSLLASKGLSLKEEEWAKVKSIEIDPAVALMGLSDMSYQLLEDNVTHIIHAAWPMNYLIKLHSFRYQFQFLRNLLQLATRGNLKQKKRFVFLSSIASVARSAVSHPGSPVPESPIDPEKAACSIGYADGKLVCEKMLERALESHGGVLESVSVRCGQISGSRKTGVWNTGEQIPMLIRTAQSLGSLPILSGTLSWIPVDDAAAALTEITFSGGAPPPVLHLENPARQPWEVLLDNLQDKLGLQTRVSFDEWLQQVHDAGSERTEDYPAMKLYAFFRAAFRQVACGDVILGTELARARSMKLRDLSAIDDATIQGYIHVWKDSGYLLK